MGQVLRAVRFTRVSRESVGLVRIDVVGFRLRFWLRNSICGKSWEVNDVANDSSNRIGLGITWELPRVAI